MGFRVQGLGFSFGFRDLGLGGLGFRVVGFRVFRCRLQGLRAQGLEGNKCLHNILGFKPPSPRQRRHHALATAPSHTKRIRGF